MSWRSGDAVITNLRSAEVALQLGNRFFLNLDFSKSYISVKVSLGILARAQKEKRKAVVKGSVFLENMEVLMNRTLIDIQLVKAGLLRSHGKEGQAIENWIKMIFVIKWQKCG